LWAFLSIDTEVNEHHAEKVWWLCDILPLVDAVDDLHSHVGLLINGAGHQVHQIGGVFSLALDEDAVGSHHIFRLSTSPSTIICDDVFKGLVKRTGLTGLSFRDAFEPAFEAIGVVKSFSPGMVTGKGHGLITPQGGGKDIVFLESALTESRIPAIGQAVRVSGRRRAYGRVADIVSDVLLPDLG
jgi:cold shock CspA family protein